MPGTNVNLPDDTPVVVKLSADKKGMVTLGIRIDGSEERILAQGVTMPKPNSSKSWRKKIGELV